MRRVEGAGEGWRNVRRCSRFRYHGRRKMRNMMENRKWEMGNGKWAILIGRK